MADTIRTIHKKTGNFLEDFHPGQRFRHKGGKTITEGLFTTFTEFAMTANPLAKNARYARAYGFEGLVVPPGLAMLVAFSQTVEDVSENARTNREYVDMRFGAPVYVGDTIEVETKVLSVVPHRKDPNLGIVHVQSTARKNVGSRGEAVVMTWQRKVDVFKRDQRFVMANGLEITRDVGFAVIRSGDFKTVDEVVFGRTGDLALLGAVRIGELQLHHETVHLRLGERVRPFLLDGVLGGQDHERLRKTVAPVAECHLPLLHGFEESGLHLRGGPVDLVRQHDIGEHRTPLDVELLTRRSPDAGPDDVRRHQVGGELQPAEGAADDRGHRRHRQGLGEAGHAFDQAVAPREQAHDGPLHHAVLTDDHPLHLEEGVLEQGRVGGDVRLGRRVVVHRLLSVGGLGSAPEGRRHSDGALPR